MTSKPDPLDGELVVEIGCGRAQRSPGQSRSLHLGVDLDSDQLRLANVSSPAWSFLCADARNLPLADRSCAVVTLRAVLHHLIPITDALRELARVLSPTGVLTIEDGVLLDRSEIELLEQDLAAAGLPPEPCYGFELQELAAELETVGLRIQHVERDGLLTFATPPFVSRPFTTDRFKLKARHRLSLPPNSAEKPGQ